MLQIILLQVAVLLPCRYSVQEKPQCGIAFCVMANLSMFHVSFSDIIQFAYNKMM